MRFSISIPCYNTLPILRRCLEAVLGTTGGDAEIILVNNHPPHPEVEEFLRAVSHPRVRVLDPGRNLGCHHGQAFGLIHGTGEYAVKLDDDIVVPPGWAEAMQRCLVENPQIAYVALPWAPVLPQGPRIDRPSYSVTIEEAPFFGCVMLRMDLWRQRFIPVDGRIYGMEESFYQQRAAEIGRKGGYLVSHQCVHLARTAGCDPAYGVWKVFYAFGRTGLPYETWRGQYLLTPEDKQFLLAWGYLPEQLQAAESHLLALKAQQ